MLCSVVVYFTLVFWDGHVKERVDYLQQDIAGDVVAMLKDPENAYEFKPPECCKKIVDVRMERVKKFVCYMGPEKGQVD